MADQDAKPSLGRAFVVTLIVPLAYVLAQNVPAPGVLDASHRFGTSNLNVVALGIMPALSAYTLVELFALATARWRRLRHTLEGRRKLDRAVAITLPLLASFQAFG